MEKSFFGFQNFNLKQAGFALLLALGLSGCNTQISDYVEEARREPATPSPVANPQPVVEGALSYKFTSGKLNSSTTNNGAVKGLVTPTNQVLRAGADMSITVNFSSSVTTR